MTRFQKKEQDAINAFQKEMNAFGLTVDRRSYGGMYSDDMTAFDLEISTIPQPVKGQKALIEKLEATGYTVWKWRRDAGFERPYFVFAVRKVIPIQREDGDAEEYKEEPERPVLIHPEIGKTYKHRRGGMFRCLYSMGNGGTFINTKSGWKFQAIGVRQYKDGTIEWEYNHGDFTEV